jgi:hypothetical protein
MMVLTRWCLASFPSLGQKTFRNTDLFGALALSVILSGLTEAKAQGTITFDAHNKCVTPNKVIHRSESEL